MIIIINENHDKVRFITKLYVDQSDFDVISVVYA